MSDFIVRIRKKKHDQNLLASEWKVNFETEAILEEKEILILKQW